METPGYRKMKIIPMTDFNNRINLQNLVHIAGGDAQFTRQMLITFLETTTRGLQEMNEAVNSDQWNTVAELAHKMLAAIAAYRGI